MKKLKSIIWTTLGVCYLPIFITGWILQKVARLLLAFAYLLLLEKQKSKDIIWFLFVDYGKQR